MMLTLADHAQAVEDVAVIHVEDQRAWRKVVQTAVESQFPGIRYLHTEGGISEGLSLALSVPAEQVLIVADLRIEDYQSELDSVGKILDEVDHLSSLGIVIFVLSGYVSADVLFLLERKGIRIFQKDQHWNQEEFLEALGSALWNKQVPSRKNEGGVYSIRAKLRRFDQDQESHLILSGTRYFLEISIHAKPLLEKHSALTGRGIVLHVSGRGLISKPATKTVVLPGIGQRALVGFQLTANSEFKGLTYIAVLGFHQNHLLCILELPLEVA
jgi:hypothetical protein